MPDRDDCGGGAAGDPIKPSVDGVLDGVEFDDSDVATGAVSVVFAAVVVAVDVVDVPKRGDLGAGACEEVEAPANRDGLGAEDCDDVVPVPNKDDAGIGGPAVEPNRGLVGVVDCEDVATRPVPKANLVVGA